MDEGLTAIFILIVIFGFIFSIVYVNIRRRERQMMIEKGMDASNFFTKRQSSYSLKFGLLFVGIAIGIILGNILHNYAYMDEESAYFSMIFLFGGLGLVIDYFLEKRGNKKIE